MRRREFITLVGGAAAAWPLAARAQQRERLRRVGVLMSTAASDEEGQARFVSLVQGMQQLGWAAGHNLRVDARWPASADEVRRYAQDLVAATPDVILATGANVALLQQATQSIPIVFVVVLDPVGAGYVASLARPGGNTTGFAIFEHSFAGKWLEMLKEVVPAMTRVAVMQNPDHPAWNAYLNAIREVASRMSVEVTPAPARNADEVEAALAAFGQQPNGGVILLPSPLVTNNRELIAALTLRYRLPSIYIVRFYPASGGLMSYGLETFDQIRQAANYVDRILKGAKPGELPVQAAGKFEMVINLKTAKALGITVPATMLGRADEVIE